VWYHPARLRILLDYRPALRQPTGVGEYAHYLAAALQRRLEDGDELTLFSSSWKDRLPRNAVAGAASLDVRVPVRLLNLSWHRFEWPPVERFGVKADVAWSLHPLLIPSRRAAQLVTVHDLYFLSHPEATAREVRRDYPALAGIHARRADGVIVNSEYTRDQVVSQLQVPAERITVCYPGAPAWPRREEPSRAGPILHMGTVDARKNVNAIIQAYLALARRTPDVPPLVLAGRHTSLATLTPADDRELFRRKVVFTGYVDDQERLRLYREASMLVMASSDEGFGIPALEAMTIGLPVVAVRRGALPEVLEEAAIFVESEDRDALAAAMRRVLEDGVRRTELVERGLARARRFSWDASAGHLLQGFCEALVRRRQRA
jgi:glycosyltransferase involved in cell wall biosynthesis